jgi:hypothetical protein
VLTVLVLPAKKEVDLISVRRNGGNCAFWVCVFEEVKSEKTAVLVFSSTNVINI